jgi:hypothetical protein
MPPARFERTAPGLGILCSIHLSYGGAFKYQLVTKTFFLLRVKLCLLVIGNLLHDQFDLCFRILGQFEIADGENSFFTSALHDKLESIFVGNIPAIEAIDRDRPVRRRLPQIFYKSVSVFSNILCAIGASSSSSLYPYGMSCSTRLIVRCPSEIRLGSRDSPLEQVGID